MFGGYVHSSSGQDFEISNASNLLSHHEYGGSWLVVYFILGFMFTNLLLCCYWIFVRNMFWSAVDFIIEVTSTPVQTWSYNETLNDIHLGKRTLLKRERVGVRKILQTFYISPHTSRECTFWVTNSNNNKNLFVFFFNFFWWQKCNVNSKLTFGYGWGERIFFGQCICCWVSCLSIFFAGCIFMVYLKVNSRWRKYN